MTQLFTPPSRLRRTFRRLAVILPVALLLVLSPAAHAQRGRRAPQNRPAADSPLISASAPTLLFAGKPLPAPSSARAPYRDPEDGILCAAPESLAPLGISFKISGRDEKVTLTGSEGTTVSVAPRINRQSWTHGVFVPVVDVIEALGGKCQWDNASGTLAIRSVLKSVEIIGGQLRIRTTLPVTAKVTNHTEVQQVIVDLNGVEIGTMPRSLSITAPNVGQARCGQFDEDTTRIVLEMTRAWGFAPLNNYAATVQVFNPVAASRLQVADRKPSRRQRRRIIQAPPTEDVFNPGSDDQSNATPPVERQEPPQDSDNGGIAPAPASPAPRPQPRFVPRRAPMRPAAAPTQVQEVVLRNLSPSRAQVIISAGRLPKYTTQYSNHRLTLNLLNATFATGAITTLDGAKHPLLNAIQTITGGSIARIVLDLSRVVVYSLRPSPAGLVLDLALPRSAGGTLAGKTVVVDAGHGGHDTGAIGSDHSAEKHVNLAIANAVAESLRDAGANVVVTRSNDTFVELDERCAIANRADADFFLAIHADSEDRSHTVNGSTVYYHFQVPSCRALAQCIAERLAAIGGIRTKGTRTDRTVAPNRGFAVLRGTRMVGVLVECGYMTNPGDVKRLHNSATQQRIAKAITLGLRDYIEGNPDANTRRVNATDEDDDRPAPTDSNPADGGE